MEVLPKHFSGSRVLVVDDDHENVRFTSDILARTGMCVQTAESGFDGLNLLSNDVFDLMLVDFILPDMTGHQFFDLVRNVISTENKEKPVIFLTGESEIHAQIFFSASSVVVKPYTEQTLLKTVRPFFATTNGASQPNKSLVGSAFEEPDFRRLVQITDGNKEKLLRFFTVYLEQFETLVESIQQSVDRTSLPSLRNVHHKTSTALNLLQLHALDADLRRFREILQFKNSSFEHDRTVLMGEINRIAALLRRQIAGLGNSM